MAFQLKKVKSYFSDIPTLLDKFIPNMPETTAPDDMTRAPDTDIRNIDVEEDGLPSSI